MATQLQIRRGTSSQVAAFTGAEGEIVVNTTNDSVHVNDGSTAGGFELARADLNNVSDTSLNAALTGNTVSALTITTLTLGSTAITATGAEINILDGVTATAAELNILDGVTATTAEVNYVDGVTSAIQTQIDAKAPLASPTFTGTVNAAALTVDTTTLVVDATNNRVGIGRTPRVALDVAGEVAIQHDANYGLRFYNQPQNNWAFIGNDVTTTSADLRFGDSTGEVMRLTSGNCGLGTTSPVTALDINRATGSASYARVGNGGNVQAYIGVAGDNLPVLGSFTNHALRFSVNAAEVARFDTSGDLNIVNTGQASLNYTTDGSTDYARITGGKSGSGVGDLRFFTYSGGIAERARLLSSGAFLVGKTALEYENTAGHIFRNDGLQSSIRSGGNVADFNRLSSDGEVIRISRDGTTVGSIGSRGGTDSYILLGGAGLTGSVAGTGSILPTKTANSFDDNVVSLGFSSARFKDAFVTNGVTTGSDRDLKENIEQLSEAEKRVAVAAKGLLRKYRWKDAVAEKGDDARIHVGIIAQELQDAFTAEGLDAARYGMWCSDTWTNDDGSKQTRLSIRYSELLAFIISAL